MANILDYLDKYGDIRFENMKFNEVDNLILSTLSYINFSHTRINENCHTLEELGKAYLHKNDYKNVSKLGIAKKQAYQVLKVAVDKERYRHLILSDFVYSTNHKMQFSAVTFRVTRGLKYIAFEGTDHMVSAWREDFEMACSFPVPAQEKAIGYLRDHVRAFGPKVIVGGHSKGGNLALVAAMFVDGLKAKRIKTVYNNDGPGLRKREFESETYQKIRKKYIHIVPHCSIVGAMMRNSNFRVVQSDKENILGHAPLSWQVVGDKFQRGKRSEHSLEIERRLHSWLDRHDDADRRKVLEAVFGTIESCGITDTVSLWSFKNIAKLIRSSKDIDKESRDLVIGLLKEVVQKNRVTKD